MARTWKWIIKEIKLALPAIIFFSVAFNLIHFTSMLMKQPGDKIYNSYFTVTIGGILVGKIILIVNAFSILNLFERRPLIYSIIWKFFVYGLASFLIRILEIVLHEFYHFRSFQPIYEQIFHHSLVSPVFWADQMWLLLVLIIFVFFGEFVHIIGVKKLNAILFGNGRPL